MITLHADNARLDVDVDAGGRIAQITVGDVPLLVDDSMRPAESMGWGSFPMAPWAGRIRHGRFRFLDCDIDLSLNHHDGDDPDRRDRSHAIHGTVFSRPWTTTESTSTSLDLTCALDETLDWPFGGTARQRIELSPDHVTCVLEVSATDATFPASIGWHPWFVKPAGLEFSPMAMYRRDDIGLPTGELVAPTSGPWDDCFVNVEPVVLIYDRPTASRVTVSSDCDHVVVFDEPGHATCVEPQSGPPDAPTIRPHLVAPGSPLVRQMIISWNPSQPTGATGR